MKINVKNKNYEMKEAVAYYIIGFQRYDKEVKKVENKDWITILKYILESVRDGVDTETTLLQNEKLLNKISFSWKLSPDDFFAYATCIFYVLTNRKEEITAEKIVTEFLSEIHSHHPRRTMKEADFILDNFFPNES